MIDRQLKSCIDTDQVLSQDLEQADPTVYEIIQKVRRLPLQNAGVGEADGARPPGEKQTEAFYQPYSLGKLYLASCPRRSRQCHAEYVLRAQSHH
jgi:hypothetical protein